MSTAAGQRVAVARRRGRGGSRDLSTGRLIADYRAAGAGSRRKLLLVAFIVANGFLEGLALTALIPALNAGLAGSDDAGLLGRILGLGSGADHDAIVVRSLIAFAVLGIASSAATLMMGRLTLHVRADIEANMREKMTNALLAMPWLPYLELRLGDIT